MDKQTIVAIATPPGRGGVGIIRLSGILAYSIACQLSHSQSIIKRQAHFKTFYSVDGEAIDQGVLLFFQGPQSFTGEDVIELHTHGSPIVLDRLIHESIHLGARLAKPGEFSERAFLNNKIDLTQAEAIADLIDASSQTAARMAMRSLQGDFSNKIQTINEQLIHLRLFVEAAIDFTEEEIDFLHDDNLAKKLATIIEDLDKLRLSASQGALLREGLSVVIAGKPNAGKSTLINYLANREVAIVTDIPGTTRDIMREHVLLDDLPLYLVDTAGLRQSNDIVEQEGIKRAWHELNHADCVLLVIDNNKPFEQEDISDIQKKLPQNVPIIRVFNKIDASHDSARIIDNNVYISAKSGEGIRLLIQKIKEVVGYQPAEGQFLARRRHLQAIDEAQKCLKLGQDQLIHNKAGELLADDLRVAHQYLCEITGAFTSDDLLGKIFSTFCIGK